MPHEKEETGYPPSAWNKENMGFIEFLEQLGDPLERIETPTEVKPNRIFEIARLLKWSDVMEGGVDTGEQSAEDFVAVPPPPYEKCKEQLNKSIELIGSMRVFSASDGGKILNNKQIFTAWANLSESGMQSLSNLFKKPDINGSYLSDEIKQNERVKAAYSSVNLSEYFTSTPDEAIQKLTAKIDSVTKVEPPVEGKEIDAKSAYEILDCAILIDAVFTSYFVPLISYVDSNLITLNNTAVFDHAISAITTANGTAIRLGTTKKTVDLRKKDKSLIDKAKDFLGMDTSTPFTDESLAKVELNTTEAVTDKFHRVTILNESLHTRETGRHRVPARTEFWLYYPNDIPDKFKSNKDFKNGPYILRESVQATIAGKRAIESVSYTKLHISRTLQVNILGKDFPVNSIVIKSEDLQEEQRTTATLRAGIHLLAELFSTRPPGAWRDDSLDAADMDIANTDDGKDSYRKGRGAVPFLSNTNVSDQSISQGHANDAEYAGKEKQKIKNAYALMLARIPKNSVMYDYAVKRIADLTK